MENFSRASLRDASGQPITTLEEARKARDEFMRPFSASTETKVLEELNAKIQGRKAELAKWEDEKNPPLTLTKHGANSLLPQTARTVAIRHSGNMGFNGKLLPIG